MPSEQENAAIAADWRRRVLLEAPVELSPNPAGALAKIDHGVAGGFLVHCTADTAKGRQLYMKPRVQLPVAWKTPAREKICADLAFDLGVSVPPVLLHDRESGPPNEAPLTSVSLLMNTNQLAWREVENLLEAGYDEAVRNAVLGPRPRAAAEALAFDTWVGQSDHNHPSNIILGWEPESFQHPTYWLLDFGASLGAGDLWLNGRFRDCLPAPIPSGLLDVLDPLHLSDLVRKIEEFPDAVISDVVQRIPQRYLNVDEKSMIETALRERRRSLRSALRSHLLGI